eukprot:2194125-Rhodomonas_salina.2
MTAGTDTAYAPTRSLCDVRYSHTNLQRQRASRRVGPFRSQQVCAIYQDAMSGTGIRNVRLVRDVLAYCLAVCYLPMPPLRRVRYCHKPIVLAAYASASGTDIHNRAICQCIAQYWRAAYAPATECPGLR